MRSVRLAGLVGLALAVIAGGACSEMDPTVRRDLGLIRILPLFTGLEPQSLIPGEAPVLSGQVEVIRATLVFPEDSDTPDIDLTAGAECVFNDTPISIPQSADSCFTGIVIPTTLPPDATLDVELRVDLFRLAPLPVMTDTDGDGFLDSGFMTTCRDGNTVDCNDNCPFVCNNGCPRFMDPDPDDDVFPTAAEALLCDPGCDPADFDENNPPPFEPQGDSDFDSDDPNDPDTANGDACSAFDLDGDNEFTPGGVDLFLIDADADGVVDGADTCVTLPNPTLFFGQPRDDGVSPLDFVGLACEDRRERATLESDGQVNVVVASVPVTDILPSLEQTTSIVIEINVDALNCPFMLDATEDTPGAPCAIDVETTAQFFACARNGESAFVGACSGDAP